ARLQLAGDVLRPGDAAALTAIGFLVAGPHDTVMPVGKVMQAAMRQDEAEDLIGAVGQTFLGLTVNCARCHDHKFDPITQRDYYRWAAALAGVEHGERDLPPDPQRAAELARLEGRLAAARRELAAAEAPARDAVLADRREGKVVVVPRPLAEWDF